VPTEPEIKVPLSEAIRQMAREAGREAAREVLVEHRAACPVGKLQIEIWGNGQPGMKAAHADLARDVKDLRASNARLWKARGIARGRLWGVLQPVISSAISAAGAALLVLWAAAQRATAKP